MLNGIIKTYKSERGFGFITPDDGSGDVFMHVSSVQPRELFEPREGMRVSFETFQSERGLKAVDVRLAQGTPAA